MRHRYRLIVTLVAAFSCSVRADVVFVDDDAPPGGNGLSWDTAYRFLQDALASAPGSGTEIRIAQGNYVPDRREASPGGTGDRTATFQLLTGVAVLGGFAGIGSPDPDVRDVTGFPTVLSGDLNGDDGPPASFLNNGENSWNVVTADGTASSAILDGCTVTGGNADGPPNEPWNMARGGGIWNGTGDPTLINCRIEYNSALTGAGMSNHPGASSTLTGCTFRGNVSLSTAGGMNNYRAYATVTDCLFIDNSSGGGGGMFINSGTATIVAGSTFCDNSPSHIAGNWSDAGGNFLCPLCDESSGPVLEVPADYPTIQAAIDAACDGAEVVVGPGTYYERINFSSKSIVVRSTSGPEVTTIDAQRAGRAVILISAEENGAALEGFTIVNGLGASGGGARIIGASTTLVDCHFRDNVADIGGGVRFDTQVGGQLTLLRCVFDGNQALVSSGAVFSAGRLSAVDCLFTDHHGGQGPGAIGANSATYVNCVFAGNSAEFIAGGVADAGNPLIVNCVFSRNTAPTGGGMEGSSYLGGGLVVNCTFSLNQGSGVGDSPPMSNCVFWGNIPDQIADPAVDVTHSNVQGGWPGTGNIDADPLFVQPGTDDVRLAFGSPCVDAGNNADLPPDTFDLDGDGNTAESIPFDLGGSTRIQGGTVDMGAWEGEFEPGPPASGESDLDQGDSAVLVPGGTGFNPVQASAVIVTNTSGSDNATFVVTQFDAAMHPGAEGFAELGDILQTETSLADGEYRAAVFIPFDARAIAGAAPQQLNLTFFDKTTGNWALASSRNTQMSPGFGGPIGNRIVAVQGGAWGLTLEVGDYGVVWDPQLQQGFVWANVDHEADFGIGFALCPPDCLQTPDGFVGIRDLLALLSRWGTEAGGGPCDVDDDGMIDLFDFGALLDAWGPCQAAPAAAPVPGPGRRAARWPDLDTNGVVDTADLEMVISAWGPCGDCPADLDGDGSVGIVDFLMLVGSWGPFL